MSKTYTHCEQCGEPKKPPARPQKGVPRSAYEQDPYCSRECAAAAHAEPKR